MQQCNVRCTLKCTLWNVTWNVHCDMYLEMYLDMYPRLKITHLDHFLLCSRNGDSLLTNTYSWKFMFIWNAYQRNQIIFQGNHCWTCSCRLLLGSGTCVMKFEEIWRCNILFHIWPAVPCSLHGIELHQSLLVLPHLSQNSFWLDTAQKARTQSQSSNPPAWKRKWKIRYVWLLICSFLEAGVP